MSNYAQSLQGLEKPFSPEVQESYRTRPLPTTPTSPKSDTSNRQRMNSVSRAPAQRMTSDLQPSRPVPQVLPLSRYHSERIVGSSPALSRRSSVKIKQLTGCAPDLIDDPEAFERDVTPRSARSSISSEYALAFDPETLEHVAAPSPLRLSGGSAPPPLDLDDDAMTSKSNSWTPKTPRQTQLHTSSVGPYSTAPPSTDHLSESHIGFGAETAQGRRWRSSSYFTDAETADEYHKIATDLATYSERTTIYGDPTTLPTSNPSHSRMSFSSKIFGSRRRNPPKPLMNRSASATVARPALTPYPRPASPSAAPGPPELLAVSSTPCSVFESDDDDDVEEESGNDVRDSFIDFFRPRSTLESPSEASVPRSQPSGSDQAGQPPSPGLLMRTGGQVKDFLANARHGARKLHVSRAEKRRNQLRTQIRVIPEVEHENNFI